MQGHHPGAGGSGRGDAHGVGSRAMMQNPLYTQGSGGTDADAQVQHLIKCITVGAAGVGKTSLLNRLFSDSFDPCTQPTIGVDFRFKRYQVDDKSIGVTLWDTAGAERFSAMTAAYFRGAHGVILVYDVTRRATLDALETHWLREVAAHGTLPDAIKLVVGNKIDLADQRQVSSEEGAAFARRHGCLFKEASAAQIGPAQGAEDAHDALVWGLLVCVAENERLLKSFDQDRLQLEKPADAAEQQRWGCC